jgi:hypothetical protein
MPTGPTDDETTTATCDVPKVRALYGVMLRTVLRAIQTKNPDALIAGAVKLHDLIHYLLDHRTSRRACERWPRPSVPVRDGQSRVGRGC